MLSKKKIDMKTKGSIEDVTFNFLTKSKKSMSGSFYLPPKLHKLDISVFDAIKTMVAAKTLLSSHIKNKLFPQKAPT